MLYAIRRLFSVNDPYIVHCTLYIVQFQNISHFGFRPIEEIRISFKINRLQAIYFSFWFGRTKITCKLCMGSETRPLQKMDDRSVNFQARTRPCALQSRPSRGKKIMDWCLNWIWEEKSWIILVDPEGRWGNSLPSKAIKKS